MLFVNTLVSASIGVARCCHRAERAIVGASGVPMYGGRSRLFTAEVRRNLVTLLDSGSRPRHYEISMSWMSESMSWMSEITSSASA